MIAPLPSSISESLFDITTEADLKDWLSEVEKAILGLTWHPLGGIENNVHTVEVASDPALALVERPTNGIDALLDLRARERGETAATPHEAARKWWGVPAGGLAAMSGDRGRERERRELADLIRVTMHESGDQERPTIVVQDQGTGQHPEDFPGTLLSLLASNKKGATHQMGVYNAGGAASFKFAKATVIASRLAPTLRQGRSDEIGVTVVRYDPLDPEKYKSGVYQYMAARDGSIIRLGIPALSGLPYGTYIKLLEYLVPKYARAAYEPKRSLWHLFHAALPDPALPIRIIETRAGQFPGVRGDQERRVVAGLQNLLSRPGTSIHSDERELTLDEATGKVILRYYVLNDSVDPDAYTTSDQSLTITLNGQRQITKDRQWLRRNLELFYLYKRLVVLVDATKLTSAAKRQVFSSTRETGVDTPVTKMILDRVVQDLVEDEELDRLEELAKQRALQDATEATTEKIKRQLAGQIAAFLQGNLSGREGGESSRRKKRRRRHRPGPPPQHDDSQMLEVPDKLTFITDPIRVQQGGTASFSLAINAKNGFLPRYAGGLSIVFGPELAGHVKVISTGSLLGGRVRITIEATADAPVVVSAVRVALVVHELGVLLANEGTIEVREPQQDRRRQRDTGGQPDIKVLWVGRERWDQFEPPWDAETVGSCNIYRDDLLAPATTTKVEWVLNKAFLPFEQVVEHKRISEHQMTTFQDGYAYPVLFALFRQRLAEEKKESEADEEGRHIDIPSDYVKAEHARTARAVLMAMEPEVTLAEAVEG